MTAPTRDEFYERVFAVMLAVHGESWVYDDINTGAKVDVLVEVCRRVVAAETKQFANRALHAGDFEDTIDFLNRVAGDGS